MDDASDQMYLSSVYTRYHSLVPRRSGGGAKEKNAWYTLFAHALN